MKIAFHSNNLGIRGTEVSLYDYAKYNEELLNNESIIIAPEPALSRFSHPLGDEKFRKRFKVIRYQDFSTVEKILDTEKVDVFYAQKAGSNDKIVSSGRKTVVHCVFSNYQPHGDVYAYISKYLGDKHKSPFVPYMVTLPEVEGDLRKELGIPDDVLVFGRHGGSGSFDISLAHDAIKRVLKDRDDIFFLFLNTNKFVEHPRVKYLDVIVDLEKKVRFINSCDGMIHARHMGETFGLAIAEFSLRNKPVFTYAGPRGGDTAHLDMLGDKAIRYESEQDLYDKICNFQKNESENWNVYTEFNPVNVMKQFQNVFLSSSSNPNCNKISFKNIFDKFKLNFSKK